MAPFAILIGMWIKFDQLGSEGMRLRFGALYENLDLGQGRQIIAIPTIFVARRLILAITVVFCGSFIIQIHVLLVGVIAQVTALGLDSLTSTSESRREYFNEIIVLMTLYSFMCFTNFVQETSQQYFMGFIACFLVFTHLLVNFYLILELSAKKIVFKAKVCFV